MSHDDMITIHADILQVTDAAVLVNCDDREIWLPLSQIDFAGEKGDTNTPVSLPEWLAAEKGLSDRDGMTRATVTALYDAPGTSYRACQKCVHYSDDENYMPDICQGCSQGNGEATEDHWEEAAPESTDSFVETAAE